MRLPGSLALSSFAGVVVIGLLWSPSPFAQETTYVRDAPGKLAIEVTKGNVAAHHLSPTEAGRFNAGLEQIRALIAGRPILQQLRGVDIAGYIRANDQAGSPTEPIPGFGFVRYYPIILSSKTGQPARFIVSTWEIAVGVNSPCSGLEGINLRSEPRVYIEPKPAGEMDGVKVYTVMNGSELIVFTRNGKLPWVPVTREEYAGIWTGIWKKQAATMPPAGAAAMQEMLIDKLEAGLRALSPEQRRMQARSGMETAGPESSTGSPLVKADPGWFDPALPRSAIQAISLKFDYSGDLNFERPEQTPHPAALRVWETLHRSTWNDFRSALTQ